MTHTHLLDQLHSLELEAARIAKSLVIPVPAYDHVSQYRTDGL